MLVQTSLWRDGVARCARYAFGPNRLHLCGPDANAEVLAYLQAGATDLGLTRLLEGFNTLYPYLQHIAQANQVRDPFDTQVVEAYWIGNELLERIPVKTFYRHLTEGLGLQRRYSKRELGQLTAKLPQGARMHHSFHVFNAYKRTGHNDKLHTLESMDACRVSWGQVAEINGPTITVNRRPLLLQGHQLALGDAAEYIAVRRLEDDSSLDELKQGDWLTLHWGVPCEVVNERQVKWLEHYTKLHLALANQTL